MSSAPIAKKKVNNIGRWIKTFTPQQRTELVRRACPAQWGPPKQVPKKADDGPWKWPININRYDRFPALTSTERKMLANYAKAYRFDRHGRTMDFGKTLNRLIRPLNETFDYTGIKTNQRRYTLFYFLREIERRGRSFWG